MTVGSIRARSGGAESVGGLRLGALTRALMGTGVRWAPQDLEVREAGLGRGRAGRMAWGRGQTGEVC